MLAGHFTDPHHTNWSSLILASETAPNFSTRPKRATLFHSHSDSPSGVIASPSYSSPLQETQKLSDGAIGDSGYAVSSLSPNSRPGWLNYEIPSGPPFWAHYNPKKNRFRRPPITSLHPHDLFRSFSTMVCRSTVQVIKPNSKHDTRIHHLDLDVGTANQVHVVNRTVNNFFLAPLPRHTSMRFGSQTPVNSDV